ncbi:EAL domain-containing protein [Micromonospora sp. NPDC049679]|uniref:EAL domain-containing protein n=1 Tax=Micromonospora sp. NPDC049679 TaxID=3155920 RepID=UPI0033F80654
MEHPTVAPRQEARATVAGGRSHEARAARRPATPAGTPGAVAGVRAAGAELINSIIDRRAVEIVYQPVFDALGREIVGFEALTRGPEGPLRSPLRLFAAARAVGRAGELDWICRAAAFRGLMDAELHPSVSLFANVEPDSLIMPCPEDLLATMWEAEARLRVFIDVPARALARYPLEVLESVRRARAAGWGVSLDDLEFSPPAMALLPTLEPDVIRLDHALLHDGGQSAANAFTAALTECERVGTVILVQHVEDGSARMLGRPLGPVYRQGIHHGEPGSLPRTLPVPHAPVPLPVRPSSGATPWEVVTSASGGRHWGAGAQQDNLDRLSRHFAAQAARTVETPAIAVVFPENRTRSSGSVAYYRSLLESAPLSLFIGRDVNVYEDWRTRTGEVPPGHPLDGQFCLLGLSASAARVLVARPVQSGGGAATPGTWDIAMSHDPMVCRQVMRDLLHTMDRLPGGVRWERPAEDGDPPQDAG